MKRYIPLLILLILFPLLTTVTNLHAKYVTIGVERGAPGVFRYNNEPNGYLYDIFKEWAKFNKKSLVLRYYENQQELLEEVESQEVDFGLLIGDAPDKEDVFSCASYQDAYSLSSTIRLPADIAESDLLDSMRGKSLYLSAGATHTAFYKRLVEDGAECKITFSDSVVTEYRLDRDILIKINKFNDKRIQFSRKMQNTLSSTIVTASVKKKIKFDNWYEPFVASKRGVALVKRYARENLFFHYANNGYIKPVGGSRTSKYDDLFKEIAAKEELDWRLLSAIAFVESKYHNDVVSPNGAVGLMQIMPQTGAVHGRDKDALLSPYVNVSTAAKHLHTVARKLKINGREIAKEDRLAILIGAYNCGHGHMQDVLRLTTAAGKDPNKWADVSFFLTKMNEKVYYQNPQVKFGKFNGSHTVRYVNEVLAAIKK